MYSNHRICSNKIAFTLIELLVVISIISLLVAILLPVLRSARERGRAITCMANERQSFMAIALYKQEYKNWYPTAGRSYANNRMTANWSGAVAHYASVRYITEWNYNNIIWPDIRYISVYSTLRNDVKPNILKCPSDDTYNYWKTKSAVSYRWNTGAYGLGRNDSFTLDYPVASAKSLGRVREYRVLRPATTIMLGEHNPQGQYEYQDDQFNVAAELLGRHNESANVLWADGHATITKAQYITPDDFDRRK